MFHSTGQNGDENAHKAWLKIWFCFMCINKELKEIKFMVEQLEKNFSKKAKFTHLILYHSWSTVIYFIQKVFLTVRTSDSAGHVWLNICAGLLVVENGWRHVTFSTFRHLTATFGCSLKIYSLFLSLVTFQYQKQGKDLEKVKQRLAEIANYVDKVHVGHMQNEGCWIWPL